MVSWTKESTRCTPSEALRSQLRPPAVKPLTPPTSDASRRAPRLRGEAAGEQLLEREAVRVVRHLARVAHPGLAAICGVESWQGRPFLVVEFLRGGTLADRLCSGALPGPEAVPVAVSLAEALAALHEAGYLHGDVKPSNIGFTVNGLPKLLDFGLARGPRDVRITGGTLRYLSPEVLAGHPAAEADDVWSLCVVLYEMVVGEHPFAGDGADEVAERIREQRLSGGGRPTAGSTTSGPVAAFAASVLAAPRSARLTTARAFADWLGGVPST